LSKKFDPWDWLGVQCGGFHKYVDMHIVAMLEELQEDPESCQLRCRDSKLKSLVCTLLCNTDAFEFDEDPTQLRFVGDDQFKNIGDLIDAWDQWFGEHH
jgi:hypothetical protein